MLYSFDGKRLYSPHDLVAYLEGDFAAWCERMQAERALARGAGSAELEWLTPDEEEEAALRARMGREHEVRYLQQVKARHPDLIEIFYDDPAAGNLTLAALRAGAPAVYQAHLSVGGWQGWADFLIRCTGRCNFGDYLYVPWDTKLARSAKPYFLIQLCAYAELLEKIQGVRPSEIVFVLGDGRELHFKTDDFYYYYLSLKQRFLEFQASWVRSPHPDPGLDRSWGHWSKTAQKLLAQSDHLSRVAGITRSQVACLTEAGITCLQALASSTARHVPGIGNPVLQRLQSQARLQAESLKSSFPCWELRPEIPDEPRRGLALLPPPSPNDVFFDMEGFPYIEGGLEYLWGAVTVDGGTPEFHDWWAHDPAEEKLALEQFTDWVWARWKSDPTLHLYHYASYEPTAIERLKKKYGEHATREDKVDDLLRNNVFVDLYPIVRQAVVIGTPSYSLKDIERLYLPSRTGDVVSAGGSTVEYQRWLDEGESRRWEESPILRAIREYNRVDCESTWLLREWLLQRQKESGIEYCGAAGQRGSGAEEERPKSEQTKAAEELAAQLLARAEQDSDPESRQITQLLGWLVQFHRREDRPAWWRYFERHKKTAEELCEDLDCLGDLTRTAAPPGKVERSISLEYAYPPDQHTKLRAGSKCFVAGTDLKCEIVELDELEGKVQLKVSRKTPFPDRLSLIPDEIVQPKPINEAVFRYASAWENGAVLSQAVDDLLQRRPPRVNGHTGGQLINPAEELIPQLCSLVSRMDRTTLSIQGPPGTGKTFTAAAVIVELLKQGKRIGVTANSHKVILNVLNAVTEARKGQNVPGLLYKVRDSDGDENEHSLITSGAVTLISASKDVLGTLNEGPLVVGGTAWVFSREELQGQFDYLFIDEAGQVSLANAVAIGLSAKNLILVGDQMQLGQPTQGSHPGETGLSCLEYLLEGRATIASEMGVFLGESRRLHQRICRFISDAIYDGRLTSHTLTEKHRIVGNVRNVGTGIVWIPVSHQSCEQCSGEEVDTIQKMTRELLSCTVVGSDGVERPMRLDDILYVAPFNAQVRRLAGRLGKGARIGSVDKFQGQEAQVVIVSLCSSTLEDSPRGAEFLLSPNRLNVAISRAQALAIVVGSPELTRVRCKTVEETRLVNLLCRIIHYAGQLQSSG